MKQHKEVDALLSKAQQERRCAVGSTDALRRALKRRYEAGELISPYRNLYALPEYWQGLSACNRSLHIARGLSLLRPRWTFAGVTAADAHGFDHAWKLHNRTVCIADTNGRYAADRIELSKRAGKGSADRRMGAVLGNGAGDEALIDELPRYRLSRLYVPSVSPKLVSGIRATDEVRTLIDCGLILPFRHALSIFDSAARKGVDLGLVRGACKRSRADLAPITKLLNYADPRSENGGESSVRASIIADGFAVPQLQVEICDPARPACRYRVDFLWRLYDGRVIVLEYDGMAKYEDASMTRGRTAKQVLNEQRERDRVLKSAGVTAILHCTYEDAMVTNRLFMMLADAGVPRL